MSARPPRARTAVRLKRLLFSIGTFAAAVLLLVLAEGVLRVAHLGDPPARRVTRLPYQQIALPILAPATLPDGRAAWRTTDVRVPARTVAREKAPGALRVVALGGSATAGLGFSPNVTFARHLERMLREAYPDRPIEVLNLGIVALPTSQVRRIALDLCAGDYGVDLLIVYAGNNEFLELHAQKFADLHAPPLRRWVARVADTNLYRLVSPGDRAPAARPTTTRDVADNDRRVAERTLVEKIEVSRGEVDAIVDGYEQNLADMVGAARAAGIPIFLCTVASNWQWRGREDLPGDWPSELLGRAAQAAELGADDWREVRTRLDARVGAAGDRERHEWLYRRALASAALGELALARDDYRAATNEDPHRRRATDALAERVRRVGAETGVPVVDAIEALARSAEHGIVGFAEFYDYVHFTPRGAVLLAAEILREMAARGIVPGNATDGAAAYVDAQLAELADSELDSLAVGEWMGFSFDRALLADRDLWKYDAAVDALERRVEADPGDWRARVYLGNARAFEQDGAAAAEEHYRAALALRPDEPAIVANLDWLRAGRP